MADYLGLGMPVDGRSMTPGQSLFSPQGNIPSSEQAYFYYMDQNSDKGAFDAGSSARQGLKDAWRAMTPEQQMSYYNPTGQYANMGIATTGMGGGGMMETPSWVNETTTMANPLSAIPMGEQYNTYADYSQLGPLAQQPMQPPPQNNLAGVLSQYQPPAPAPVQQPMAAPVLAAQPRPQPAAQPRPQPAAQQKLSPSKTGLQSFASVVSPGVAPVAQPRPSPRPAPVAQTKPSLRQLPVAKPQPAMRPAPVQQPRPAAQTTRPGLQVFPSMVSPGSMARSVSRVNPPLLPTRPMGRR